MVGPKTTLRCRTNLTYQSIVLTIGLLEILILPLIQQNTAHCVIALYFSPVHQQEPSSNKNSRATALTTSIRATIIDTMAIAHDDSVVRKLAVQYLDMTPAQADRMLVHSLRERLQDKGVLKETAVGGLADSEDSDQDASDAPGPTKQRDALNRRLHSSALKRSIHEKEDLSGGVGGVGAKKTDGKTTHKESAQHVQRHADDLKRSRTSSGRETLGDERKPKHDAETPSKPNINGTETRSRKCSFSSDSDSEDGADSRSRYLDRSHAPKYTKSAHVPVHTPPTKGVSSTPSTPASIPTLPSSSSSRRSSCRTSGDDDEGRIVKVNDIDGKYPHIHRLEKATEYALIRSEQLPASRSSTSAHAEQQQQHLQLSKFVAAILDETPHSLSLREPHRPCIRDIDQMITDIEERWDDFVGLRDKVTGKVQALRKMMQVDVYSEEELNAVGKTLQREFVPMRAEQERLIDDIRQFQKMHEQREQKDNELIQMGTDTDTVRLLKRKQEKRQATVKRFDKFLRNLTLV